MVFTKTLPYLILLLAFVAPAVLFAQTPQQEREALESQLQALEEEIEAIEGDITKTKAEKETLQNRISLLQSQIRKLDLQITQSNVLIEDLRGQIVDTTFSIVKTEEQVDEKRTQLAELLQKLYQENQRSVLEIILAGPTLSEFFNNLAGLQSLQARNREVLASTIDLTSYLKDQKDKLEGDKTGEENYVKIQILQKQESQNLTQQNQELLQVTRGREAEYQELLSNRQQQAQQIRSRIFELIGVPDAPTFGEAVAIAEAASSQTGVRTALLLAVLTQESNLGKNVGQCYVTETATGNGIRISTGASVARVMKPMGLAGRKGDVQDFLRITQALGRDASRTPVSCPIPSVGGYGGAMGPAQFIPTTWALYEQKLQGILGRPGDPWNITDAFLASALFLKDIGATKGETPQKVYEYEWCAAVSYFSGSCSLKNQINYEFYGDSVMAIAARYERDIATLKGN